MLKTDLKRKLRKHMRKLSPRQVDEVIDTFFEAIAAELIRGGRVELRGFGSFETRDRKGYPGRNPSNGDSVQVPPKRVPFFRAGKTISDRLNQIDRERRYGHSYETDFYDGT